MNNLMKLKDIFKESPAIFYMLDEIERYIKKLNNIIRGQKDIRLKAIEYIEQHNDYFLLKREVKELLDILKGSDKE